MTLAGTHKDLMVAFLFPGVKFELVGAIHMPGGTQPSLSEKLLA
jgi:hypothetical protein